MNLQNPTFATHCTTACCEEWLFLTTLLGSGAQSASNCRGVLSLRLAINLDLNWQAFAHSLLLSIRKPGRRKSTTECPDVTEREQRGMNPAQPGVEIGAGA
jgi:hypothetical protein